MESVWLLLGSGPDVGRVDPFWVLLAPGHFVAKAATDCRGERSAEAGQAFGYRRLNTIFECSKEHLTPAEVPAYSPETHIGPGARTLLTVGGAELPELMRQTADYASCLRARRESVEEISAPGYNHFTVLDMVALPDGAALKAVTRAFS